MVGITRGHIADPHIVEKLKAGNEDRIRPCVGATYCSTYRHCIHNAASGREQFLPHKIAAAVQAKRATVVGGGPAGMEAARVLALRGHEVTLFEAADRLGGQIALAVRSGWRRDLIGISDWLAGELKSLAVTVKHGVLADRAAVDATAPEIVIVATGGMPDIDWVDGDAEITSTWDALSGKRLEGEVLVHDALGGSQAVSCAEFLSSTAQVEITSPSRMIGHDVGKLEAPTYLANLYANDVVMTPNHELVRAERYNGRIRAVIANTMTDVESDRIVDHLIVERGTRPNDELWRELAPVSKNNGITDVSALANYKAQPILKGDGFVLHRIGDAVTSRDIHAAILDALRLCKDL